MNWFELKSRCIDEVARDLARYRLSEDHNLLSFPERIERWAVAQKAAEPEAIEKIQDMTNMELIDLISEVVGSSEA